MEEPATPRRRRHGLVAGVAALAVTLVLAVAAWADTGGEDPSPARGSGDSGTSLPVQSDRSQPRERDGDCPEKEGRGSDAPSSETAPSALEL